MTIKKDPIKRHIKYIYDHWLLLFFLATLGLCVSLIFLPFSPKFLLLSALAGVIWFVLFSAYLRTEFFLFYLLALFGGLLGVEKGTRNYFPNDFFILPRIQMLSLALIIFLLCFFVYANDKKKL